MQKPKNTTRTTTNKKQPTKEKYFIYKYLAPGKENARTARELSSILHMERRQITRQIEKERRHAAEIGVVICAEVHGDSKGYYLATSLEDGKDYCAVLEHREAEIRKTRQALVSVLNGIVEKKREEENA